MASLFYLAGNFEYFYSPFTRSSPGQPFRKQGVSVFYLVVTYDIAKVFLVFSRNIRAEGVKDKHMGGI